MMTQILTIIVAILGIIGGLWRYFGSKNAEKRKQAERARKDLDEANKNDDPGKLLDAFGKL